MKIGTAAGIAIGISNGLVGGQHWLIELIGHVSGLSDAQLKQIEKSLPATKALVDLLNRARPIIEQAEKLYTEAEPLIDDAKKEWETVGPAAERVAKNISANCRAYEICACNSAK